MAGDFPSGRVASVLAAVDPDASGMADRGDDDMNRSVLLTAVVGSSWFYSNPFTFPPP